MANGDTYSFAAGSVSTSVVLDGASTGCTVRKTGRGAPPVINGHAVASPAGWTPSAHASAAGVVYEREWSHNCLSATVGIFEFEIDGVPADYSSSVAACAANPGTFFCPDDSSVNGVVVGVGSPVTIYYHAPGSADPRTDGRVVKITYEETIVKLGDNAIVQDIETGPSIHNDGGLRLGTNALVRRCILDNSGKHGAVVASGTARRLWIGPAKRTTYQFETGNSAFGWYTADPTGLIGRSEDIIHVGSLTYADMLAKQNTTPFTMHGSGPSYTLHDVSGLRCYGVNSVTMGEALDIAATGVYTARCYRPLPTGLATNGFVCEQFLINSDNENAPTNTTHTQLYGTSTYRDGCVYFNGGKHLFYMPGTETAVTIENSIIYWDVDSARVFQTVFFASGSSVRTLTINNCLIIIPAGAAYTQVGTNQTIGGSRNVFLQYGATNAGVGGGFSTTTNLIVNTASGHGVTTNVGMLALLDSIFSGDRTGPSRGDFRISQAALQTINGGNFPDAQPISNYTIGPLQHWDFFYQLPASGPPAAWPEVPLTHAAAVDWINAASPLDVESVMPATEFYCNAATGSNVNSGSTESATPALQLTGGNWVSATGVFTKTAAVTGVAVGDFAAVMVDGGTVAARIGRVTAFDANTVTISTTAGAGSLADQTGTATLTVGGCWKGQNAANQFPLNFITNAMTNSAGDAPRINYRNNATYSVTAAPTINQAGPIILQGYTTTPGDGGQAVFDGGTSGASFNVLAVGGTADYLLVQDIIFQNNGATGAANLVEAGSNADYTIFKRCVFRNARGLGIQFTSSGGLLVECEANGCNQSNQANTGGMSVASCTMLRCYVHDNVGSNSQGVRIGGTFSAMIDCIVESNASHGVYAYGQVLRMKGCDVYANGGDGIRLDNAAAQTTYIENTNIVDNGGWGINGTGAGMRAGEITNSRFGAGTRANASGDSTGLKSISVAASVSSYAADITPWRDPDNGDFGLTPRAARATYDFPGATTAQSRIGSAATQTTTARGGPLGIGL